MSFKKITPTTELNSYAMDMNINSLDIGDRSVHSVIDLSFIKNSNMNKNHREKLKKLQRKQSRRVLKSKKTKTKLSKNFKKTQNKINKIHKKNSDKKTHNLHALVNAITAKLKEERINHLVIEDLGVKEMTGKKNVIPLLGKSKSKEMKKNMLQVSFNLFKQILEYKCAYNEIYLETINPANTSKACNHCGNIKTLELKDRRYECGECGYENNRDYNAVLNILDKSEYAIPKTVKIDGRKVRVEPASLSL
jgi:putative transposase